MRRSIVISALLVLLALPVCGQANWGFRGNVGVEHKITKGLDAGLGFRYHQTDNFRNTDRWSIEASLGKRIYRNEAKTFTVKGGLSYKFLKVYNDWSSKYKGDAEDVANGLDPNEYIRKGYDFNYIDPYSDMRHRISTSIQASYEVGRFKFSLRETYQFTHTDSASYFIKRYRVQDPEKDWAKKGYQKTVSPAGVDYVYYLRSGMDGKGASNSNVLRSKISVDYNIPHWKYDPFISYEMFNGIDDGFKVEKSRLTVGVDFTINKKHNFEVAYMWQNEHDDDEPAGSFICLSYKFEL